MTKKKSSKCANRLTLTVGQILETRPCASNEVKRMWPRKDTVIDFDDAVEGGWPIRHIMWVLIRARLNDLIILRLRYVILLNLKVIIKYVTMKQRPACQQLLEEAEATFPGVLPPNRLGDVLRLCERKASNSPAGKFYRGLSLLYDDSSKGRKWQFIDGIRVGLHNTKPNTYQLNTDLHQALRDGLMEPMVGLGDAPLQIYYRPKCAHIGASFGPNVKPCSKCKTRLVPYTAGSLTFPSQTV